MEREPEPLPDERTLRAGLFAADAAIWLARFGYALVAAYLAYLMG